MFGYILADKPDMRIREYHTYRAYYCGLCRSIADYGQSARFLLNYDCAFLYLLHSSLTESAQTVQRKNCMAHPLRKETYILDAAADYAAAANVLLGAANLRDKQQDGQSLTSGMMLAPMKGACKKAKKQYPWLAETIQQQLQLLQQAEQRKETDLDLVADATAQLLAEILCGPEELPQKQILWELGYQLGRYVYLADAWEDMPEDRQKGRYNIFVQKFGDDLTVAEECARFNLYSAVNHAILAYDLLEIKRNKEILDNIMYRGIAQKTECLLKREKQQHRSNHGSL